MFLVPFYSGIGFIVVGASMIAVSFYISTSDRGEEFRFLTSSPSSALSQVLAVIVVVLVILAAFGGYALSSSNGGAPKVSTTTITTTQNQTVAVIQTVPGQNYTVTLIKSLPEETITEIIVERTGTVGGGGYCIGNSTSNCVGYATLQITSERTTTYVFPSSNGAQFFNGSITTITSSEAMLCGNPTTTSTTVSTNSTSGIYRVDWTWSQSCS